MAGHGRVRARGQERSSSGLQPLQPPLQVKDTRSCACITQNASSPPTAHAPKPCTHRREFAPTGAVPPPVQGNAILNPNAANRFSILAELDQQPTQAKWAFDFVQPADPTARRRSGKRRGRQSRPGRPIQQPDDGRFAAVETATVELGSKLAAFHLDVDDAGLHSGRHGTLKPCQQHHHRQQALPDLVPLLLGPSPSLLSSPLALGGVKSPPPLQPVEFCFTDQKNAPSVLGGTMTGSKRQQSRFFPPPTSIPAIQGTRPPRASIPVYAHTTTRAVTNKPASAMPTAAVEAATSAAHRALRTQQAFSTPEAHTASTFKFTPPRSPPPPTVGTSTLIEPIAAAGTPTLSEIPSLVSTPSVISSPDSISYPPYRPPQSEPLLSTLTPTNGSDTGPPDSVTPPAKAATSLLRFSGSIRLPPATSPLVSPRPVVSQPPSARNMLPTRALFHPLPPAIPMSIIGKQQQDPFYDLGHDINCWCGKNKRNQDDVPAGSMASSPTRKIDVSPISPEDSRPASSPSSQNSPNLMKPLRVFSKAAPEASVPCTQPEQNRPATPQRSFSTETVLLTPRLGPSTPSPSTPSLSTLSPSDSECSETALYEAARRADADSDFRADNDDWLLVEQSPTSISTRDPQSPRIERTRLFNPIPDGDKKKKDLPDRSAPRLQRHGQDIREVPYVAAPVPATTAATTSSSEWPSLQNAVKIRRTRRDSRSVSGNRRQGAGSAASGGGVWLERRTMRDTGHDIIC